LLISTLEFHLNSLSFSLSISFSLSLSPSLSISLHLSSLLPHPPHLTQRLFPPIFPSHSITQQAFSVPARQITPGLVPTHRPATAQAGGFVAALRCLSLSHTHTRTHMHTDTHARRHTHTHTHTQYFL